MAPGAGGRTGSTHRSVTSDPLDEQDVVGSVAIVASGGETSAVFLTRLRVHALAVLRHDVGVAIRAAGGASFSACGKSVVFARSAWQSTQASPASPWTEAANFCLETKTDRPSPRLASASPWHVRQSSLVGGLTTAASVMPEAARNPAAGNRHDSERASSRHSESSRKKREPGARGSPGQASAGSCALTSSRPGSPSARRRRLPWPCAFAFPRRATCRGRCT